MRRTQLHHEHLFVLSDVHGAGDHQVLAVGALRLAGEFRDPFFALHRVVDGLIVAGAPLPHRRGHAGPPRLRLMTQRICQGSDSHSVLLAGVADVLERCGEPVIDRPPREVLGARVVLVWLRGQTWLRGVVARAIARMRP